MQALALASPATERLCASRRRGGAWRRRTTTTTTMRHPQRIRAQGSGNEGRGGPTAAAGGVPDSFLTYEEAGVVEMADLGIHEKFLARLVVSSLNLLRTIAEEKECAIEDLNAGKIVDWFVEDAEKRSKDVNSATLKW